MSESPVVTEEKVESREFLNDEEEDDDDPQPVLLPRPSKRRRKMIEIDTESAKSQNDHTQSFVNDVFHQERIEDSVFYLRFRVSVFKEFLMIAKNVLSSTCRFLIEKSDCNEKFSGIVVSEYNDNKTCVLTSRLECDVFCADENNSKFAISLSSLAGFASTLSGDYCVDLQLQKKETDRLICRAFVPETPNQQKELVMCLHEGDFENIPKPRNFKHEFSIDFDLTCFGDFLKFAKHEVAEYVCFSISVPKSNHGSTDTCYFEVSAEGQNGNTIYNIFESKTKKQCENDPGSSSESCPTIVLSTSPKMYSTSIEGPRFPSRVNRKILVKHEFPTVVLNQCVRNMSVKRTLTLRLGKSHMLPLILYYGMGTLDSYIGFLLSAKLPDVDEEELDDDE